MIYRSNGRIFKKQLELPLDDSGCGVLNARFKRINDKHAKESFAAASSNRDYDNSRLPYTYVTAVTDHLFVPGLPFSRPCSNSRPNHDYNISLDANSSHGSLPAGRFVAVVGAMPAIVNDKVVLTGKAIKAKSHDVMDSVEGTFTLATTVCGFDDAYVIFLRDWMSRHNGFFTQPLQRYYAPSFDVCLPSCPKSCTEHQQHCLLGYCSNCKEPLVAAAQKLIEVQNLHGNAKLFSETAFLEKRVCLHSMYCPGANTDDRRMGCENGHVNSYDDSSGNKLHFSTQALYVHDILIDALAQFSNPAKHAILAEYMRAFGRAVVLRHINFFHHAQLASARKKSVITGKDFDAMLHSLTQQAVPAVGPGPGPARSGAGTVPPTPAVQTRVDPFFERDRNAATSKRTLQKKRPRAEVAPAQFHRGRCS